MAPNSRAGSVSAEPGCLPVFVKRSDVPRNPWDREPTLLKTIFPRSFSDFLMVGGKCDEFNMPWPCRITRGFHRVQDGTRFGRSRESSKTQAVAGSLAGERFHEIRWDRNPEARIRQYSALWCFLRQEVLRHGNGFRGKFRRSRLRKQDAGCPSRRFAAPAARSARGRRALRI